MPPTAVRKLILLDPQDREYRRLQRSAVGVAKTKQSLQTAKTLREKGVGDDYKVRRYVSALHRLLNIRGSQPSSRRHTDPPRVRVGPTSPPPLQHITPPATPIAGEEEEEEEEDWEDALERIPSTSSAAADPLPTTSKGKSKDKGKKLQPPTRQKSTRFKSHPTRYQSGWISYEADTSRKRQRKLPL